MAIPLPDFLRAYGELLGSENHGASRVLAWLLAIALLLFVVFTLGAMAQAVGRWWKRWRG